MKSHNVQLFRNGSDQIEEAGNEALHIGTVQQYVKKSDTSICGYIKIKNVTQMDMWVHRQHEQDSRV